MFLKEERASLHHGLRKGVIASQAQNGRHCITGSEWASLHHGLRMVIHVNTGQLTTHTKLVEGEFLHTSVEHIVD